MESIVGRKDEIRILTDALHSPEAELVAMYGRRRVGKTFLIRSVYAEHMLFEFSGIHEADQEGQLLNFSLALMKASGSVIQPATPGGWIEAFHILQGYLSTKLSHRKSVIFFDEFPWINTPRSGFVEAFGHFWNMWASRQKNLVVVICGSAAAWMIRNIVKNRGGLHNRISKRIRLMPFTIGETEDYLLNRKVVLDQYQVTQLYMALGGIPQYLKDVKPGQSAAQIIDNLCFAKDGLLKGEFNTLYSSLFDKPENHIAVIRALSARGKGLTRTEIIKNCKLSSGGTTTKLLDELVESGFITPYIPFDKNTKDTIYRLSDEYSLFYLKFMAKAKGQGKGTWQSISETASWKSWSGVAFESICLKHVTQIKKALGIAGVLTVESAWRYVAGNEGQGVQIDLVIDRTDRCINLCEIKFAPAEFTIDKTYAANLRQKLEIFRERTKPRKALFLTMITTYGVRKTDSYPGLIQSEVTMQALFEK